MAIPDLHPNSGFLQNNRKELFILILLGAIAGAVFYYFTSNPTKETRTIVERGVLNLEQISVHDFFQENKRWKLNGKRAVILEKSRRMRIEEVQVWVYASQQTESSIDGNSAEETSSPPLPVKKVDVYITADAGLIEWQDNRVTLSGNVHLLRDDSTEILTESAIYDAKSEILNLPKSVRMYREGHTLLGDSLTYFVSKNKFVIKAPILLRHAP